MEDERYRVATSAADDRAAASAAAAGAGRTGYSAGKGVDERARTTNRVVLAVQARDRSQLRPLPASRKESRNSAHSPAPASWISRSRTCRSYTCAH